MRLSQNEEQIMGSLQFGDRLGRRTILARSLAAAMALGLGSAVASQPTDIHDPLRSKQPRVALIRGAVTGSPRQTTARAPHAANSTAATITVSNCNDSGAGSLREAVSNASSGDTVDMSGLGDCTITLQSSIVTSIDYLTIQSRPNKRYPLIVARTATPSCGTRETARSR